MIDLVWDTERSGSVGGARGESLNVGDGATWSPEDLLATAAASCLMRTLLRLAAEKHVSVLGYVAAGRVDDSAYPVIRLQMCVVVREHEDVERVRTLCEEARRASVVASVLGSHLAVETNVQSICECQQRE